MRFFFLIATYAAVVLLHLLISTCYVSVSFCSKMATFGQIFYF